MLVHVFKGSLKLRSVNHNILKVGVSKSAATRIFNKIGRDVGFIYLQLFPPWSEYGNLMNSLASCEKLRSFYNQSYQCAARLRDLTDIRFVCE